MEMSRLPFYIGLIALDLYLWSSIKRYVFLYHKVIKTILTFIYWIPLLMLLSIMGASFYVSFDSWGNSLRTYYFGTIFVFYAAKLVPLLLLFLNDVFRLIRYFIHHLKPKDHTEAFRNSRTKFIQQLGLISGGIFLSSLMMGMVKWAYDFKVWRHRVKLPNLPKSFDGLKIVQLSDMHLGSMASKSSLEEAVEIVNGLNPDVIFFTGDLVNNETSEALPYKSVLANLKANIGVYATLGNHDYGLYKKWRNAQEKEQNMADLFQLYRDLGWRLLNNENEVLERNGDKLAIVGVENWSAIDRFPRLGNMKTALKDTDDVPVKLLLSHDPTHFTAEVVPQYPDIDIAFAGHTHGMQFGIEIPGFKWSPAKFMYKHWAGLYEDNTNEKSQFLYVNRGLGVIGYPGRVGILPEITLMELVR